jgi:hypothetical protein
VSFAGKNEVAGCSVHLAVAAQRRAGVASSDSSSLSSTSDKTLECLHNASALTCFMPGRCSMMKAKSANDVNQYCIMVGGVFMVRICDKAELSVLHRKVGPNCRKIGVCTHKVDAGVPFALGGMPILLCFTQFL